MQSASRLLSAVALALLSTSSFASTTVYNTSTTFMSQLAPGSYTETFTGLGNPAAGAASFSGGGFSYSASAPGNIYLAGGFLGTSQIDEALTITFSGNARAVGANFYITDFDDVLQAVPVTVTLNDGTVETFTPASLAAGFRGFVSTTAITSLVISRPGPSLYAGLDNMTVGIAAVPEPASWALMGLGIASLLVVARRRNA